MIGNNLLPSYVNSDLVDNHFDVDLLRSDTDETSNMTKSEL